MPAFARITFLLGCALVQSSLAHGILPENVKMAAGTALRQPGDLPTKTVTFEDRWQPTQLRFEASRAITLTLTNHGEDWHLFALGSAASLRDQQLIHRLMPDLRKDYPNTRLSEPGSTVTLPWRFDREGTFQLRCVRADHQDDSPALVIRMRGR